MDRAATPRIFPVPRISRYQVQMQMRQRLPGGFAVVDAGVVAIRMKRCIQTTLRAIEQSQHRLVAMFERPAAPIAAFRAECYDYINHIN